jgi:hypothetical protein
MAKKIVFNRCGSKRRRKDYTNIGTLTIDGKPYNVFVVIPPTISSAVKTIACSMSLKGIKTGAGDDVRIEIEPQPVFTGATP